MLLATLLSLAQAPEVAGLHAGETALVVDASSISAADDQHVFARPRVLDARTGAPLQGVRIETWTEDGVAPTFVQTQLDSALTGRDGCARVCTKDGSVRADKVRLSKSGYASLETGLSDVFEDEIVMYPARPLEGRVLDLEGRPVVGALVRTRYSCAHAVPASQTRTDALGRFHMEDFPPLFGGAPEVEVVDSSHAPLFQLGADDLLHQASFFGALDLYVPRKQPTLLQLVDAQGEPIPNRRVFFAEAAVTQGWTDEQGFCRLAPHQLTFEQTYELDDPMGKAVLYPALFVDGLVTRISPFDPTDDETAEGRLVVHLTGLDGMPTPPIVIVPDKRRFREARDGEEVRVPLGPARVYAGGDFTGYLQSSSDVEIGSGIKEVTLSLRAGPRVRVHDGGDGVQWSWIQAGDRSSGDAPVWLTGEGTWIVGVAPGVPVTLFRARADGELRRATIPPVEGMVDVDLTADSSLLRRGMDGAGVPTTVVAFEVRDESGRILPEARGEYVCETQSSEPLPPTHGRFAWTLPAHASFRAQFGAEGFTTINVEGNVPLESADRPEPIVLKRRAQLRVGGGVQLVDGFQSKVEPTEDGFVIDAAAGPLLLVVGREGGPRIGLDLVLAPGESRRIEVK